MINNQSIKDEVKKRAEQKASAKKCPRCGTIGMVVGKVYTSINLVSKPFIRVPGGKPTMRDTDSYPVEMVCPQTDCRHRFVEPND